MGAIFTRFGDGTATTLSTKELRARTSQQPALCQVFEEDPSLDDHNHVLLAFDNAQGPYGKPRHRLRLAH
jgi:hypothetical protein